MGEFVTVTVMSGITWAKPRRTALLNLAPNKSS